MQKNHHVPTRHSTRLDCHVDKIPYEVLSLVMENLEEYKQLDTLRAVSRRFKDVSEDFLGRSIQRMQAQIVREIASAKTEFEEQLEVFRTIPHPTFFDRCIIEMAGKKVQFMQEIQAHFRNLNALLWSRRPACASAYINCGKLLDCVTDAIQKVKEMPAEARFHNECQWKCDLVRKPYALSKLHGETKIYIWKFCPKLSQEMEDYEGSSTTIGHDGVEHTMSGLLLKDACRFIGLLNLMENSILANMNFALVHYEQTGLVRVKAQYTIPNSNFTCRKYNDKKKGSAQFHRDHFDTCINLYLEEIFAYFGRIISRSNIEILKMENQLRSRKFTQSHFLSQEYELAIYVEGVIYKFTDSMSKWLLQYDCVVPTRSDNSDGVKIYFDFNCASGLLPKLFMDKCKKVKMEVGKEQTFDMLITSYDPLYKCAKKFVASYEPECE